MPKYYLLTAKQFEEKAESFVNDGAYPTDPDTGHEARTAERGLELLMQDTPDIEQLMQKVHDNRKFRYSTLVQKWFWFNAGNSTPHGPFDTFIEALQHAALPVQE